MRLVSSLVSSNNTGELAYTGEVKNRVSRFKISGGSGISVTVVVQSQ